MGKGTILSNLTEGQYRIRVEHDRRYIDESIAILTAEIAQIDALLADPDYPEAKKKQLRLQKLSCQKRLEYFNTWTPVEPEPTAWCADYSLDIPTGTEVGTAEVLIDGEDERIGRIQIMPYFEGVTGKEGDGEYDADRDGQIQPAIAAKESGAACFSNWAMRPAFVKWRPSYRYGILTSIDYDTDKCSLTVQPAHAKLINPLLAGNANVHNTLSDVPIEYMDCDSDPFEVGDKVLIKFRDNDWDTPVVVGFYEEPKPCRRPYVLVRLGDYCIIWDVVKNSLLDLSTSGILGDSWPMPYTYVLGWVEDRHEPEDLSDQGGVHDLFTINKVSDEFLTAEESLVRADQYDSFDDRSPYIETNTEPSTLTDSEGTPLTNQQLHRLDVFEYGTSEGGSWSG